MCLDSSELVRISTNMKIRKTTHSTTANSIVTINCSDNRLNESFKDYDPHENEEKDVHYKCYCGREFITYRGLMTHRRSCFVGEVTDIKYLFTDLNHMIENIELLNNHNNELPKGLIKKGVKLP